MPRDRARPSAQQRFLRTFPQLMLGLRRLPLSRLLPAAPAGQRSAPRCCVICAVARPLPAHPCFSLTTGAFHSPSGPAPANEAALQNIVFKYVTCAQDIRCVLWLAHARFPRLPATFAQNTERKRALCVPASPAARASPACPRPAPGLPADVLPLAPFQRGPSPCPMTLATGSW